MKRMLWGALGLLAFCTGPAAAAQQVLIDTAANLALPQWKVTSADWARGGPAWSVVFRTLHGGRQEGVQVIEVDNGAMRFTIVPTRGFSLWKAQAGKLRLGWNSPVGEIVHPSYARLSDNGGQGWVAGFGALMARGGLASFGAPTQDGNQQLTLHGHVDYLPASFVSVRYDALPSPRLVFRGIVNDTQTFGAQLRLTSEISTPIGRAEVSFDDVISNLSDVPQEMELLYHTNFGTPLLGAGAEFVAPVKSVAPMNQASGEDMKSWNRYSGPHPAGYSAKVFNMELQTDSAGMTQAMLRAPDGNQGVLMRFDTKGLPYMSLWKNEVSAGSGYVTGLEPGTGYPNTRPWERRAGRVPVLKSGESRRVHLTIAALTSRAGVDQAAAEIKTLTRAAPKILSKPTGP